MKTLNLSNEVLKFISKDNYYNEDSFIRDAKRYIKAIKNRSMICNIESVSKSGMSRNIKFMAPEINGYKEYQYCNFFMFFKVLGYTPVNNSDSFRIGGCGMDMIFHTNYSIIHGLTRMGFITKKDCAILAQKTPVVI